MAEHIFSVTEDMFEEGSIPGCSCKWTGKPVKNMGAAREAFEDHLRDLVSRIPISQNQASTLITSMRPKVDCDYESMEDY